MYLEYQKKLKKKYARNEEGVLNNYAKASLMYVTKRYSAKIYHKGSEYKKNDLKEHLKYNKQKNRQYFKTDLIQAFADRTLRYELTIRNSQLNYLHKHYIFRKNCKTWKSMYRNYILVEGYRAYNDRLSKAVGKLKSDKDKMEYLLKHPYKMFPNAQMKTYHKIVCKIISRRRYFKFRVSGVTSLFNTLSVPTEIDNVLFSKELYDLCLKDLIKFIKDYQIKELPNEDLVKRKIEDFNKANKSQLPKSEMLHFYKHLLKHGSFKEAVKYSDYSRSSIYRYVLRFSKIGITEKCLKPIDKFYGIPEATIDFIRYHYNLMDKYPFLRGMKLQNLYHTF